jgi:hypothetical protein
LELVRTCWNFPDDNNYIFINYSQTIGDSMSSMAHMTPWSLLGCINENGDFEEGLYYLYRQYKHQQQAQDDLQAIIGACQAVPDQEMSETTTKTTPT